MTIPQTVVADDFDPMLPGTLATTEPAHIVGKVSATVEGVFGDVAFAVAGDPEGFTHTVSAGNEIGVVLYSHNIPTTIVAATGDVPTSHMVNILKKGVINVTSTEQVTDVTAAVTYAANGKFGVGQANVLAGAKWRSLSGAGGEVVQVELNLP